jgi:hypothetical protein
MDTTAMTNRPPWWPTATQKLHADAGCAHPDTCHVKDTTMTETTAAPTCRESVSNGTFFGYHTCGRPVKDEGLCGLHLSAKRRRVAKEAAYQEKRAAEDARQKQAQDACDRLADRGIRAQPHYDAVIAKGYTGRVVIMDPEALLKRLG